MTAAITAAEHGMRVTLLEGQSRVGRKLLSTGNGRCNISNENASAELCRSDSPELVAEIMENVSRLYVLDFLADCGISCMTEREGRMYPQSEQASSVLDMLRLRLEYLGVNVQCDSRVLEIKKNRSRFSVSYTGGIVSADKVIIACGSQAAPQLGGCDDGCRLLRSLGHTIKRTSPSLVPVQSDKELLRPLKGVRVHCRVSLLRGGVICHTENGEVQFNEECISGIAVFQISARLARFGMNDAEIALDLMPDICEEELISMLEERSHVLGYLSLEDFLTGMLNKRVGTYIMGLAGCKPLSRSADELEHRQIMKIAALIKKLVFPVQGTAGWKQAQLSCGGASLKEFDAGLQSKLVKGLYACGEVLDCDFDCGGFNLHWAWCSAITAGRLSDRE